METEIDEAFAACIEGASSESRENVAKHMFAQMMLHVGRAPESAAENAYAQFTQDLGVETPRLPDVLLEINASLEPCGMQIQRIVDERTAESLLVFVNLIADEPSKVATSLNPKHISLLRWIIDRVMHAPNLSYAVTYEEVQDVLPTWNMSRADLEDFLVRCLELNYLVWTKSDFVCLASRLCIELEPYLKETYGATGDSDEPETDAKPGDLRNAAYVPCQDCHHMVTLGWRCPNEDCPVRLHRHCASRRLMLTDGKCPGCAASWGSPAAIIAESFGSV